MENQIILTSQLGYNSKTKTFCEELSTLDCLIPGFESTFSTLLPIEIKNPKSGISQEFRFNGADESGGDIMGYNFISDEGIHLLLIND